MSYILSFAWPILISTSLYALEPLVMDDIHQGYLLGPHLECLEDSSGAWTIEDVSTRYADRFVPSTAAVPNFGKTKSAIWVRFRLEDRVDAGHQWVLDTSTIRTYSDLRLFVPVGSDSFVVKRSPVNRPFGDRELRNTEFVFLFPENVNWERPFYYRVVTESTISLELEVFSLLGFYETDHDEQLRHGFFYGLFLAMICYNLFVFISLRDLSYLYYVLYVGSVSLFLWCNTGLAFEYLWGQNPWWNDHAPFFIAGIAMAAAIQFCRSFLGTQVMVPAWDRGLRALAIGSAGLSVLSLFDLRRAAILTNWVGLLLLPVLLGIGWVCWRRGSRPARYYLVAWTGLLASVSLYAFKHLGYFLLPPQIPLAEVVHAGVAWEAILLSLGLADRINVLRRERDYQQAKSREAQAASQAKGTLLANMSHELRTPMNAILGYTQLVRGNHEGNLTGQQLSNLEVISRNAGQLLVLIEQLLDLSRLEAGRMKVVPEPFDIREVIDESLEVMAPMVGTKSVVLSAEFSEDVPACHTDRTKVRQIVVNLLGNAIKFTEAGEVRIHTQRENGLVKVAVVDTGRGIKEGDLGAIFEEFHQVLHPRMGQGTGLGLAITRRLCRLLGGEVSVTSVLGQGSTFTVILPAEWKPVETPTL